MCEPVRFRWNTFCDWSRWYHNKGNILDCFFFFFCCCIDFWCAGLNMYRSGTFPTSLRMTLRAFYIRSGRFAIGTSIGHQYIYGSTYSRENFQNSFENSFENEIQLERHIAGKPKQCWLYVYFQKWTNFMVLSPSSAVAAFSVFSALSLLFDRQPEHALTPSYTVGVGARARMFVFVHFHVCVSVFELSHSSQKFAAIQLRTLVYLFVLRVQNRHVSFRFDFRRIYSLKCFFLFAPSVHFYSHDLTRWRVCAPSILCQANESTNNYLLFFSVSSDVFVFRVQHKVYRPASALHAVVDFKRKQIFRSVVRCTLGVVRVGIVQMCNGLVQPLKR